MYLILVMHVVDTVQVIGVKLTILLKRDLRLSHPEWDFDRCLADRTFHRTFVVAAHRKISGRDMHQLYRNIVA